MITEEILNKSLKGDKVKEHYYKLLEEDAPVLRINDYYLDMLARNVKLLHTDIGVEYVPLAIAGKILLQALLKYSLLMERYGDATSNPE